MSMRWTTLLPTQPGFYYWQNTELQHISVYAVRVVQVSKLKNRDGFHCATLTTSGGDCAPVFSCDLDKAPLGHWAGPLPQPY